MLYLLYSQQQHSISPATSPHSSRVADAASAVEHPHFSFRITRIAVTVTADYWTFKRDSPCIHVSVWLYISSIDPNTRRTHENLLRLLLPIPTLRLACSVFLYIIVVYILEETVIVSMTLTDLVSWETQKFGLLINI